MDDELVIHALTEGGVARLPIGAGGPCQRLGTVVMHSFPRDGGNGDPCACGAMRRGVDVEPALDQTPEV